MPIDLKLVGGGRKYSTPIEAYDGAAGKYHCDFESMPLEELLPLKEMPRGPDKQPFTVLRSPAAK